MGGCTPCGAGLVGTKAGSQSAFDCSPCPPSTFSSAAVSTACTPCAAGSFSSGSGAASASDCVAQADCVTAKFLAAGNAVSASASLCPIAGLYPIAISGLLPSGANFVAAFMLQAGRLTSQINDTGEAASAANAVYKPAKMLTSLRMAAVGNDATLSAYRATEAQNAGASPDSPVAGAFTLSSATTAALLIALLVAAFAPLVAYRLVPARIAVKLNQFSMAHETRVGAAPTNTRRRCATSLRMRGTASSVVKRLNG